MKKFFWPRSLAGQLTWILFGGVTLSLISSAAIHLHDRNEAIFAVGELQTAQKFAAIVQVMDPLSPQERDKIATILQTPLQFVRLLDKIPPRDTTSHADERTEHLKQLMIRFVGTERILLVDVLSGPDPGARSTLRGPHDPKHASSMMPMGRHHQHHMSMMGNVLPLGPSFVASVELSDGVWLESHNHLPEEAFIWPW
ncbi:MAG: hypothetical protein HQL53_13250, partial [Magnetococcales bacterium]|nr:hypothetical protein [Magnetococcales bacterium]